MDFELDVQEFCYGQAITPVGPLPFVRALVTHHPSLKGLHGLPYVFHIAAAHEGVEDVLRFCRVRELKLQVIAV